jgi:Na+:H+ antiporter, NhaA family
MTTTTRRAERGPTLLSPLRDFLRTEASSGVLLVAATLVALLWANSPWSDSYESFWQRTAAVSVGGWQLELTLQYWVNDALMAIFFFVVGLEIKRELANGHLSTRRTAMLPVAGALGGMLVPALIYLAIAGSTAPRGWAVPVATDIALAVGVVTLAGTAVPSGLRAFLLGLAIVDDIGAILIIALVYSSGVKPAQLAVSVGAVLLAVLLRRLGVRGTLPFLVIAMVAWYYLYKAGIHPTLAGVAMGLLAPTEPHMSSEMIDIEEFTDVSTVEAARTSTALARNSVSEVEWLQHMLHPWTSFVIVPIFAIANAGVEVSADGLRDLFSSALGWGIALGLLVGKPLGIWLSTRLAVRIGVAEMPAGHRPRPFLGVGMAAGIGFTVALFVAELAFTDPVQRDQAKLAVLLASVMAGALALPTLRGAGRQRATV